MFRPEKIFCQGTPPPPRNSKKLLWLRGGRYASCVHAGGLSCLELFLVVIVLMILHKVNNYSYVGIMLFQFNRLLKDLVVTAKEHIMPQGSILCTQVNKICSCRSLARSQTNATPTPSMDAKPGKGE